jgi:hypothetical protein
MRQASGDDLFGTRHGLGEFDSKRIFVAPEDAAIPGVDASRHTQKKVIWDVPHI